MDNKYEFITVAEFINESKANEYEIMSVKKYIEDLKKDLHTNQFAV